MLLIAMLPLWEANVVATRGTISVAYCNGTFSSTFCRLGLLLGQTFGGADYSYFGYVILAGSFGLFLVYLAYGTYRRFLAWDKLDSV